jgi:spermidine synthase/S-adenosylmethionine decarboxylase
MNGLHLIADLEDCCCTLTLLLDAARLEELCVAACRRHGLTVVGCLFHAFGAGAGVTGTVVLAESHLAIHTWPEIAAVTLDVYVCNFSGDNSTRAYALFDEMVAVFSPARANRQAVERGRPGKSA